MIVKSSIRSNFAQLTSYVASSDKEVGMVVEENLFDHASASSQMNSLAEQSKVEKPVYHIVLSYHEKDAPSDLERIEHAREFLKKAGLEDHQAVIATHNNTNSPHTHIVVNRVHPLTHKAEKLSFDRLKNREIAIDLEKKYGLTRTGNNSIAKIDIRDIKRQDRLGTAESFPQHIRTVASNDFNASKSWDELKNRLQKKGLFIKQVNNGYHITDGIEYTKASKVSRQFTSSNLSKKFGETISEHSNRKFGDRVMNITESDFKEAKSWTDLHERLSKKGLTLNHFEKSNITTITNRHGKRTTLNEGTVGSLETRFGQAYRSTNQNNDHTRGGSSRGAEPRSQHLPHQPKSKTNPRLPVRNASHAGATAVSSLNRSDQTISNSIENIALATGQREITITDQKAQMEYAAKKFISALSSQIRKTHQKADRDILKALQIASSLSAKEQVLIKQVDSARANVIKFQSNPVLVKRYSSISSSLQKELSTISSKQARALKKFAKGYSKLSPGAKKSLSMITNRFMSRGRTIGIVAKTITFKAMSKIGIGVAQAAMSATIVGIGVNVAVASAAVTYNVTRAFHGKVAAAQSGTSSITRADQKISRNNDISR